MKETIKIRKLNIQSRFIVTLTIFLFSCDGNYTPKPRGYFRIDFPEREYQKYVSNCPYSFEVPTYVQTNKDMGSYTEPCWINICYPRYRAEIHISYKPVDKNSLNKYLSDSYTLVQKHNIKAEAIKENIYINNEKRVYGMMYEIKGNAASNIQFFLTDSTQHFFRGALYFNLPPNKDSLAPVISFIKDDIAHLIETFEWQ